MQSNKVLKRAKREKIDEFYTRLTDIEKELRHYRKHFWGKTVLCNCDDPHRSNFFKYFVANFNQLGLKKLISTCYAEQEFSLTPKPYKAIVTKVNDTASLFTLDGNELTGLDGDGDCFSDECLALLDEADIVATNPPFSLFRQYVNALVERGKTFVIIGNRNAITYREIFPLVKENKIWLGVNRPAPSKFYVPTEAVGRGNLALDDNGNLITSVRNVCWFTNLDIKKRHKELTLVRDYNPADYPKYDNYDAIEVSKVADIPRDWSGKMGVPITFMDKYNPDQFEIIKFRKGNDGKDLVYTIDGKVKYPYFRIIVRKLC